jgi:hypothetical protein
VRDQVQQFDDLIARTYRAIVGDSIAKERT